MMQEDSDSRVEAADISTDEVDESPSWASDADSMSLAAFDGDDSQEFVPEGHAGIASGAQATLAFPVVDEPRVDAALQLLQGVEGLRPGQAFGILTQVHDRLHATLLEP